MSELYNESEYISNLTVYFVALCEHLRMIFDGTAN